MSSIPQQTFELENRVQTLASTDAIFHYDAAEQKRLQQEAPWKKDPHFFKSVKISAIALTKMVTHARSGGAIEVMGLMQGKVTAQGEIIIMDCFALPVEGTETRVNAGDEAYEYMIQFGEASKQIGRLENAVGWYHSHPGYGCWLSGIDVGTQSNYQTYQDPFLAVVIDPNRTISAGAVEIGAFRTFPEDYKPAEAQSEYQSVPLDKIEDFGVHASRYYSLEVSYFKSSLDIKLLEALWNKYWVTTLSQSPLATNRAYTTERLNDLTAKLKQEHQTTGAIDTLNFPSAGTQNKAGNTDTINKLAADLKAIETGEKQGLKTAEIKSRLMTI
ncbi:JAB1/Mov34/MPN/PAD-1 ubiquitin protease-domain-containing protein [Protomyces lactucae-debilis]|uniref:COP9 signalosome complex subunit 5 n=1 Tax=Protomyces lactucae-debilis TaxID=2754530 RepID=A0A1Y2FSY5_PROLT|nr:JAB1/Mov34/MPN/PAD-1 ubiquitin protease-domain-containing protein [Protomyces lactucae-debilis]ORY86296.1 JAB1/Mov34/MPN/PAD-1 ubiquitin protease-domain-containing protein [Protomyces lactucae-debilis]